MSHHRNPRALLTPTMHNVLDRMARAPQVPLHALTPAQARVAYEVGRAVLQLLFYPGCAAHQDTPSHKTFAHGFMLEEPHINYFFNHYLRTPMPHAP